VSASPGEETIRRPLPRIDWWRARKEKAIMEYLGLALVAALVLGGGWWLSRLISRTERNEGDRHGGGIGGMSSGI
jgi:hypothetical protein